MNSRNFGLDLVRASAIIFVLISHSNDMLPLVVRPYANLIAFDGVSIFFVLSGFLIGGILLRDLDHHQLDFKYLTYFWNRRWFRTLPNYFLVLILLLLVAPKTLPEFDRIKAIPYFFFSQNLFYPHPEKFFTEAWSLSVEEWFYIAFPLLFLAFIKIQKDIQKAILTTAFIVISFSIVSRIWILYDVIIPSKDWVDLNIRKMVITRFDSLFIGVIGAYFLKNYRDIFIEKSNVKFVFGAFIFLSCEMILINSYNKVILVIYPILTSISILLMFPKLMSFKPSNSRIVKIITYTSLISYSLYLTNLALVKRTILRNVHLENEQIDVVIRYALFWIICFTLSAILYNLFEKPIMNLRKKHI